MAYLQNRLSVSQVAFEFNSSVRVFKVPELNYTAIEEKTEWQTRSGKAKHRLLGVWLNFSVNAYYFKEQVSGTSTDRIDILDALVSSGTVYFYPDYEEQPTIKYIVKSGDDSGVLLLQTKQGLFKPGQTISMAAITRLSTYPTWLKYR